jgi:protein-L-isoaspartate(D-aspartate) O-methyltransferase
MTDAPSPPQPTETDVAVKMRNEVVDDLIAEGTITSGPVEAAMRKVPRELFAPGAPLEEVYHRYNGVVTKRDDDGTAISSVSAPQVQAYMMEAAGITPGMNILEYGGGGANAAMLAELVGDSGQVTTVDIDSDVTERAARVLAETGYSRVKVILADAEEGVPSPNGYDRIMVTFGAYDVPPAWTSQLAENGRLLVPLQLRGLSRTIAFEKADDHLVSYTSKLFGFVPVQGAGAHEATLIVMRDGEVTFRFDEAPTFDPNQLKDVFDTPRTEVWSGATIGRTEPWDTVHLWLATAFPGFCRVVLDKSKNTGLISPPGSHTAASAVVDGDSFAYITTRGAADAPEVEFGAHAYGPHADELAEQLAEQLRIWANEHRGGPGAKFYIHPAGTPDNALPPGRVIDKPHSRITISWPASATAGAGQGALHHPNE